MMLRHSLLVAALALIAACDQDPNEPTGTALVRFVNAAPGTEPLDVFSGSTALATGMTYGAVSACVEVPVGRKMDFKVGSNTVATLPVSFQPNARHVVVLTRSAQGLAGVLPPRNTSAPGRRRRATSSSTRANGR